MEAPGLAAFLPGLCRRLLDEDLQTPSQATLWLGEGAVVRTVLRDLEGWVIRAATDGETPPVLPTLLSTEKRAELAARMAAQPARYAASVAPSPSLAPCVGPNGLDAKPIALRVFLTFDGSHVAGHARRPGARPVRGRRAGRASAAHRRCRRTSG